MMSCSDRPARRSSIYVNSHQWLQAPFGQRNTLPRRLVAQALDQLETDAVAPASCSWWPVAREYADGAA